MKRGLLIVDRQPRTMAHWRPQIWSEYESQAREMLRERKATSGGLPPGERLPICLVDICVLSIHAIECSIGTWETRYVYEMDE